MTPDQKFEQLNLVLPPAPKPLGVYKPLIIVDKFVYVSGHGTVKEDRSLIIGRIGKLRSIAGTILIATACQDASGRCWAWRQAEPGEWPVS